jgi:hypothetical protein
MGENGFKITRFRVIPTQHGIEAPIIEQHHEKMAKHKRKLSKYNLHMSKCLKGKSGPIKRRFSSCVVEWKKK